MSESVIELELCDIFRLKYVKKYEIDPKDLRPCVGKEIKRNKEKWIIHIDKEGNLKQYPLG
jgi:hypothetical protein